MCSNPYNEMCVVKKRIIDKLMTLIYFFIFGDDHTYVVLLIHML